MSAFEFFFSFFGLVLGLSVAAVVTGLADVLRRRAAVRIGALTPMLAILILIDISTFWITAWNGMQGITIGYASIFGGLAVALPYYLAASTVFPKDAGEWTSLDDYYDSHKRIVLGGVLISNLIGLASRAATVGFSPGPLSASLLVLFFALLVAPMLIRDRRVNLALLTLHCAVNLLPAFVDVSSA